MLLKLEYSFPFLFLKIHGTVQFLLGNGCGWLRYSFNIVCPTSMSSETQSRPSHSIATREHMSLRLGHVTDTQVDNPQCHDFQSRLYFLSSRTSLRNQGCFLSKDVKIKIYKTIILPVVLY